MTLPTERVSALSWRFAIFAMFAGNGLALGTWASRTPAVADSLHLGLAQMGLLITAIPLGALLGLLVSSHLLEALGERRTAIVAQIIGMVALGGFGINAMVTGNPIIGAPLLVLYGVGTSISNIVINLEAASSDRVTGRTLMPLFHAAFSVGAVVGAALGAVSSAFGVPLSIHFSLVAVAILAIILGVVHLLPELRDNQTEPPSFAERMKVWVEPRTLLIGVIVLSASFTEGTANNWLSLAMVTGRGWQPELGATTVTVFAAAMVAGRFIGGWFVDKFGRVAALRTAFALATAGVLVVTLVHAELATFAAVALWGLGASLGYPLGISAAADEPRNAPARVAAVATVATISGLLGPTVIGLLGEFFGLPQAFVAVVVLLLIALAVSSAAKPPA
jgi:MFS family permease